MKRADTLVEISDIAHLKNTINSKHVVLVYFGNSDSDKFHTFGYCMDRLVHYQGMYTFDDRVK